MEAHVHRHVLAEAPTMEGTGGGGNRTGDSAELTQASFDTNMVIILAALLCALICALGLNSMVRCVLRCTNNGTRRDETQRCTGGLKKSVLRKIPIFVYGSDPGSGSGSGSGVDSESECPICLGEFVDGEKVRVLPKCNHGFHVRCIDTWLGSHSSCPNCRLSLVDVVGTSKAVGTPRGGGGGGEGHVVVEINDGS